MYMYPSGSIIAVLQVEGRFFRRCLVNILILIAVLQVEGRLFRRFLANILIAVLQVEGRFFFVFRFWGIILLFTGVGGGHVLER